MPASPPRCFQPLGVDWNHDTQPDWAEVHDRFAHSMDVVLAAIKRRQRKAEFLSRCPLADHYRLAEYVSDKQRSF